MCAPALAPVSIARGPANQATREKAKAAVSQLRTEPRFCDHPDGFHVEAYELDAHDWPKGSSPSTSRVLLQALPPNKTMQMTAAGLRCAEALHDTNLGSIARGRR